MSEIRRHLATLKGPCEVPQLLESRGRGSHKEARKVLVSALLDEKHGAQDPAKPTAKAFLATVYSGP